MQNSPLVSVICLCYNHSQFVVESLESVLNQTYNNIEILIADDCSTDNSVEVIINWLKQHPQITFIINTTNKGNTKTFNQLLKLSKGDYILDLATDDVLEKDCIEKQIHQFKNSKSDNLGIVYGNIELIDENNKHLDYYYKVDESLKTIVSPPSGDIYLSIISDTEKICSVSSLVKRDALLHTNGYDENLAYEDLDLWIRVARKYDFEYIDAVLAKKRELKNSLYHHFFLKNNKLSKRLQISNYQILVKVFKLNKNRIEDRKMLKRVHTELFLNIKFYNLGLVFKYLILKMRIHMGFRKFL